MKVRLVDQPEKCLKGTAVGKRLQQILMLSLALMSVQIQTRLVHASPDREYE